MSTETLQYFVPVKLTFLLAAHGLADSKAEAARKIKEGAVYISVGASDPPSWLRISDPAWEFDPAAYPGISEVTFRIGRRPLKLIIKP